MLGYLNRPEETAALLGRDGYGCTGDVGYFNEKGELYFVDRIKELMKYVIANSLYFKLVMHF